MAVLPVLSEPVSGMEFAVIRERTGKSGAFRPVLSESDADYRWIPKSCGQIPCLQKQGIFKCRIWEIAPPIRERATPDQDRSLDDGKRCLLRGSIRFSPGCRDE